MDQKTSLLIAGVLNGRYEDVELLVKKGADMHALDEDGHNAIYYALNGGGRCTPTEFLIATLKILIELGNLSITKPVFGEESLLDMAATGDDTAADWPLIARFLIDTAIKNKEIDPEHINASLFIPFAGSYHEKFLDVLADYKIDYTTRGKNGKTFLMEACENNRDANIKFLLERGVDINARDDQGLTALSYLASNFRTYGNAAHQMTWSSEFAISELLNHGADPDILILSGEHFIEWAEINQRGLLYDIFKQATPDIFERFGTSALYACARFTQYYGHIVELLLEHGFDINMQNEHGVTPLMIGYVFGSNITQLLELGARPSLNLQDKFGRTVLMRNCRNDCGEDYLVDSLKILLQEGAHTDIQDNEGNTALIHAATTAVLAQRDRRPSSWKAIRQMSTLPKKTELLLQYNADLSIKNKKKKCFWDIVEKGFSKNPDYVHEMYQICQDKL